MLSVRLALFTAIAGVCLWGLFSLLDTLNEPGLLRTEKAVVIKGCDTPDVQSKELCAQLRCQKSLLEQKRVPLRARFEMLPLSGSWIGGRALDAKNQAVLGFFACAPPGADQTTNQAARWLDEQQFDALR